MAARIVEIVLTGNASQAMAEMQKLAGTTEATSTKMSSSFTNVGKVALLGLGAGLAAAAVIGVKAAQEQEAATARLKQAVENSGQSFRRYSDEISNAENHAIKLGFADDVLDTSLAKLVPVTKNVHEGVQLMNLAEDIARGRHIDLSAATDILVKVQTGHVAMLGRIGINTKDATGATISQEEAIKRLSTLYGGQAQSYAGTFAGKLEVIKAQADELAEKIGFVLIPIIEGLGSALVAGVRFFEQHRAAAVVLAAVIGGPLVAAMLSYAAAQAIAVSSRIVSFWTGLATVVTSVVIPSLTAAGSAALAAATSIALVAAPITAVVAVGYGLSKVFGGVVVDFKAASEAGKAHGAALVAQSSSIVDTTARLDQLKATLRDTKNEQITSVAGAVAHHDAVKILQGAIADLTSQQEAQGIAAAATGTELEQLASGTKDLADASKDATTAIQNMQNVILAAQGGLIGYEQAQANATAAQDKLTEAVNQYGLASPEAAQAARDVEQANLAVSSAALKLADDNTALSGTMNTKSIPSLQIMRQSLLDQAAAHDDTSGAIAGEVAYIDQLIAKIQATPSSAHTTFYGSVDQSFWDSVNSVSNAVANTAAQVVASVGGIFGGQRAAGGPVMAGTAYVVGERGPELFMPNTSGTIVPNAGGGLFAGATVMIGTQDVIPDLDWWARTRGAGN